MLGTFLSDDDTRFEIDLQGHIINFMGNVKILTHYDRRNVCYRYTEMLKCKKCVE